MSEFARVDRGYINLRGDAGNSQFIAAVAAVVGCQLAVEANTWMLGRNGTCIYWLGPDEWLIGCERKHARSVATKLEAALTAWPAAINDVSGGLVLVTVAGSKARALLARGSTLDLNPAKFAVGDCAQTTLAKAIVLLACIDDAPVYEIIVRRSFSEYLLRWLRKTRLSLAGSASSS